MLEGQGLGSLGGSLSPLAEGPAPLVGWGWGEALSSLQALGWVGFQGGIVIRGIGDNLGFYILRTWERLGKRTRVPCVEEAGEGEEARRGLDLESRPFPPVVSVGQHCAVGQDGREHEPPRASQVGRPSVNRDLHKYTREINCQLC